MNCSHTRCLWCFPSLLTIHSVVVTINTSVNHQQSVDMLHLVARFALWIHLGWSWTHSLFAGWSYCCSTNRSCPRYSSSERRLIISRIISRRRKAIVWFLSIVFFVSVALVNLNVSSRIKRKLDKSQQSNEKKSSVFLLSSDAWVWTEGTFLEATMRRLVTLTSDDGLLRVIMCHEESRKNPCRLVWSSINRANVDKSFLRFLLRARFSLSTLLTNYIGRVISNRKKSLVWRSDHSDLRVSLQFSEIRNNQPYFPLYNLSFPIQSVPSSSTRRVASVLISFNLCASEHWFSTEWTKENTNGNTHTEWRAHISSQREIEREKKEQR